jgi:hypothetical protein
MVHRRRGLALTVEELRAKINFTAFALLACKP